MALSVFSSVPAETEEIVQRTIGCAIEVHRHLGPGFLERIYAQALAYELEAQGLSFERERAIVVHYKETRIAGQRIDLIVAGAVIVQIKAVAKLDPVFESKMISYLRTTGLRVGLLMNFDSMLLKEGLKRIVV